MKKNIYLSSLGIICALGNNNEAVLQAVLKGDRSNMLKTTGFSDIPLRMGKVTGSLPTIPVKYSEYNTRNNQLLLAALEGIQPDVRRLQSIFSAGRIGIVLGTSTSGILEGENALFYHIKHKAFPADYYFNMQELGDPAFFLSSILNIAGPSYTISTACSSSAKVFSSAKSLICSGMCDAVIVGGADSLCRLTVNGFRSLESVSPDYCQPFSATRSGINIGEGAALFCLTTKADEASVDSIKLCGVGESSDAWHISAPHPEGRGAQTAMNKALTESKLTPDDIDYINLHGTATPLNDAMESQAVNSVFSNKPISSSTKTMTGHTLGAAGAIEAGISWLLLSDKNTRNQLPPHIHDTKIDNQLLPLKYAVHNQYCNRLRYIMSNSFAFGGNNVSIIFGK